MFIFIVAKKEEETHLTATKKKKNYLRVHLKQNQTVDNVKW